MTSKATTEIWDGSSWVMVEFESLQPFDIFRAVTHLESGARLISPARKAISVPYFVSGGAGASGPLQIDCEPVEEPDKVPER